MEDIENQVREAIQDAVDLGIDPVAIEVMLGEVAADVRHGRIKSPSNG